LIKLGINKCTAWKIAYAEDRIAYVCNKEKEMKEILSKKRSLLLG
jgi:hypothetical protein